MENVEALQALERGERLDQEILLRLREAQLIRMTEVTNMQSPGPEFIFVGFTPQGSALLTKSKAPLVSDLERQILAATVRGFLDRREATSSKTLLQRFKTPVSPALQRLTHRGVLNVVNNTYLSETYLPKAVAFHHCGDSAALTFARKSAEAVLRVLPILFDRQLDSGDDQKQFTPDDVVKNAPLSGFTIDPDLVFTGLYLAQEFSLFTNLARDQRQVGIISFRLGERVYEKQYLDWDEHIRQSNVALVYDQTSQSKTEHVGAQVQSIDIQNVQIETKKIFVVHGRAEESKQAVAGFLRSGGLQPIILHEQPNEGRTIVEKFEKHSGGVGFAVVLLTPDDIGAVAEHPTEMHPRARQNVILELGYFMGKLGRGRVCALYVQGVELPSDYHGVLWVPYDDSGAWREQLAKELSAAGIELVQPPQKLSATS